MRKTLLTIIMILGVAGCTQHYIPSYEVDTRTIPVKQKSSTKLKVISKKATCKDDGTVMCRVGCFVRSKRKMTFTEYISEALTQELKLGNLLNEEGNDIFTIQLTKIEMSTAYGDTHWIIDSPCSVDGETFLISTTYNDRSSFAGIPACNDRLFTLENFKPFLFLFRTLIFIIQYYNLII